MDVVMTVSGIEVKQTHYAAKRNDYILLISVNYFTARDEELVTKFVETAEFSY